MRARTREEMQGLDRRAIEEFGVPGLVLMENAGLRAADAIASWMRELSLSRALIFCGRGNNGGDGYVVARHLSNRGVPVEVWRLGGEPRAGSDAAVNQEIVRRMRIPMEEPEGPFPLDRVAPLLETETAAVDALLGTGLSGEVREPYRAAIDALNAGASPIFAIDCPTGLDCNTGRILGTAVRADQTITFVASKIGFTVEDGPAHVGRLIVADISIPRVLLEEGEETN